MQQRGVAGARAPLGNAVRTPRALPRRAFRPVFARRPRPEMAPPKREHRVVPLGDNKYRLITTVTVERDVTVADLARLGVPLPSPELPWKEEPAPPPPPRQPSAPVRPQSTFTQAMTFWRRHFKGFDARLPKRLPEWLDEFGIEGVLAAMAEVADHRHQGPPYLQLVQAFDTRRAKAGAP